MGESGEHMTDMMIYKLNLHHYLLRELHGYLVHPSIPTGDPNLRVADVGTGTGIWLTDIAHHFPSNVRLDGLDISLESTPPKEWLPQNGNFREWNILSEVPSDLVGVYDIVNISLLMFVLKDDEIKSALGNLLKLLKPGGYLQWAEVDLQSFRIRTSSPENKTEALADLMKPSQPKDARS
ncbi:hypothetical protein N7478_012747 [Penicillium angulare]|uniref:uncharacterized protein n=1 Tax=Penicillium angulare TaxID=116970 RepID=UPI002540009B|nr:uncharacterized protein N7478_012747 [Penicillium angulare]KAJ5256643.1 hypothetical protein N7478_012747 [Penicillium angulare]